MKEGILVVNAGSSSIKFSLYVTDGKSAPVLENKGMVDGIYVAPKFVAKKPDGSSIFSVSSTPGLKSFTSI